jgi:hypothetical protein
MGAYVGIEVRNDRPGFKYMRQFDPLLSKPSLSHTEAGVTRTANAKSADDVIDVLKQMCKAPPSFVLTYTRLKTSEEVRVYDSLSQIITIPGADKEVSCSMRTSRMLAISEWVLRLRIS